MENAEKLEKVIRKELDAQPGENYRCALLESLGYLIFVSNSGASFSDRLDEAFVHWLEVAELAKKARLFHLERFSRKDSRPNWYKIAEAMGEQYVATMVLSQKGNEPLFRDFNDAVDELGDLLNELNPETWSWHLVEQNYSALYAWFKNHMRTDSGTVDTKRVTDALPERWASCYWQLD